MNRYFDRQIGPMGGMQPNPSDLNRSPQPMGEMNQGPSQRGMGPGTDQVGYGEGDLPDPTDPKGKIKKYGGLKKEGQQGGLSLGPNAMAYAPEGAQVRDMYQEAKQKGEANDMMGAVYANPEYMKQFLQRNTGRIYLNWNRHNEGEAMRLVDTITVYESLEGGEYGQYNKYIFEELKWDGESYKPTGSYTAEDHMYVEEGDINTIDKFSGVQQPKG